ncbi:zinc finger, CCHC-type containing protein [Tanacetum coccineum]
MVTRLRRNTWLLRRNMKSVIKTYRGGEYYDPVFFQSVGIIHETTAPYTPQQNGVAERKNRALKEMVNSMLSYSGLSEGFWGEAMAIVRLPDPKRKTLGEKGIDCIFVGYVEHSKAYNQEDINQIRMNVKRDEPTDDLYLVEGSRDQVGSQYSYCYSIEEDPRTYNEAMQSRDSAFWKEAIDDEIGSIMENNTWVLSDLPPGCKPLEGYSDASWINHVEDSSSTSGWVFLLGGGAISWASKKQICITTSTMKYEFVALVVAGKEAEWLRNLIHEIPIWPKPIAPISIRCDSAPTMTRAHSQIYNEKFRHLGVRHSMVRELIRNGVISIEFVQTQHNFADHLMKGLARDLVIKSVIGMGLKSI